MNYLGLYNKDRLINPGKNEKVKVCVWIYSFHKVALYLYNFQLLHKLKNMTKYFLYLVVNIKKNSDSQKTFPSDTQK